ASSAVFSIDCRDVVIPRYGQRPAVEFVAGAPYRLQVEGARHLLLFLQHFGRLMKHVSAQRINRIKCATSMKVDQVITSCNEPADLPGAHLVLCAFAVRASAPCQV